jgi:FMN phosphatase YigB (HAD superfamily)
VVFFDVGGTLVDRGDDPAQVLRDLLAGLGVHPGEQEWSGALRAMAHAYTSGIYAPTSAAGEDGLWRAMATAGLGRLRCGARPDLVAAVAADLADYPRHYRPVAGMPELVAALRARGPVGIISNWPPSLPGLLRAVGYGTFPVVACSGPLRCAKPDPGIFRWALREAGVRPEEAWYVGNDTELDYRPARSLGMRAVLWDPQGRARGLVRAGSAEELRALLGL